ncbi:MAG: hypothetical protein QGG64_19950 [Candidatus Latescibacteria bacterium]|jgi:hypothetical protein|nr:hypothetical protein [Candidatus Latescibacterota bacterium]
MLNDYQLHEIEVEATNPVNADGRFTKKRSARLFIGQTKDGNVRRFRDDVPDDIIEELNEVVDEEPTVTDLFAGLTYVEEYKRILGKQAPVQRVSSGLGYRYPDEI